MPIYKNGYALIIIPIVITLIIITLGSYFYYQNTFSIAKIKTNANNITRSSPQIEKSASPSVTLSEETIVIKNSGSGSIQGWELRLNSNGSGNLHYTNAANNTEDKTYAKDFFNLNKLYQLLNNYYDIKKLHADNCTKSNSGVSEYLIFNNQTSGDISCRTSVDKGSNAVLTELFTLIRQAAPGSGGERLGTPGNKTVN